MTDTTIKYEELSREELIILAKAKREEPHPDSIEAMLKASPKEARRIARRQVAWYSWAFIALVFGCFAVFGITVLIAVTTQPSTLY